jgi:hypothetical protein
MALYRPPGGTTTATTSHGMAVGAAWISLAIPVIGMVLLAVVPPMRIMAEETIYWMLFACGAVGAFIGGLALTRIGRRMDWGIVAPAILGIVFSSILCYFCIGLGIVDAGVLPRWSETHSAAPGARG